MPPGITYGQATSRHILFTVYITTNIHFGSSAKNALTVEREQGEEEEEEARGYEETNSRKTGPNISQFKSFKIRQPTNSMMFRKVD